MSTFLTIRWRALRVQQGASTGRARCSGWGGEQTRSAAPTETRARLTRRQTHCWGGGGHLAAYDPRQDRIGDQNGHQSQNHKGQSGNQTGLQPVHRSDHAVPCHWACESCLRVLRRHVAMVGVPTVRWVLSVHTHADERAARHFFACASYCSTPGHACITCGAVVPQVGQATTVRSRPEH